MKIELGKQYIRRDGTISGILRSLESTEFPFADQLYSYNDSGRWSEDSQSGHDLIREYEPPIAEEAIEQDKRIQEINAGKAYIQQNQRAKSDVVGTGLVLIPWYSILAIGKIFIEGLRYGRDNWKKGVKDPQYQEERLEHAMLHLLKWKEGDRSEAHLAKVAWFCVTQLELERLENCHALMPEKQPNPDL